MHGKYFSHQAFLDTNLTGCYIFNIMLKIQLKVIYMVLIRCIGPAIDNTIVVINKHGLGST